MTDALGAMFDMWVAPLGGKIKELEQLFDKAKEYQGMWLDRGCEIANLKTKIKELEAERERDADRLKGYRD